MHMGTAKKVNELAFFNANPSSMYTYTVRNSFTSREVLQTRTGHMREGKGPWLILRPLAVHVPKIMKCLQAMPAITICMPVMSWISQARWKAVVATVL